MRDLVKQSIYRKAYYLAHKEQETAVNKKYYVANHKKILLKRREYAAKNSIDIVTRVAKWQKDNPEKFSRYLTNSKHKRRAQKNGTSIGKVDFAAIHTRNGMTCGICHQSINGKFHYDHIIPLSKGGAHITENIQLSHPKCNRVKFNH